MSMERSTGPRIYVPISMPDHASQPTYAVLEFVGFSTPAPPSHPHFLHSPAPIPSPAPAMLCLPPAPSSSTSPTTAPPPPSFFPLSVAPPHPYHHAPPLLPMPHFPDANTLYLPSPPHLLPPPPHHYHQHHHVHGRPYPSARLEVVNLDSPPSSPSSVAPSSASSASRESSKEKHSHSSAARPTTTHGVSSMGNASLAKPMVCYNSSPPDASSTLANGSGSRPMANFSSSAEGGGLSIPKSKFSASSEGDIMQTQISVSQTDRETIVHTHSSNFRDVVRQLTGASSDDQDLLPVTLPARLANRVNNTNMGQNMNVCIEGSASGAGAVGLGASMHSNGSGGSCKEQLGLRKAPLKLHERRKSSMKNLEKITGYNFHGAAEVSPIMNPSPVTPLASDFERFCNASTPTSQGSSGVSSPIGVLGKGKNTMEAAGRAGELNNQQDSGCFFSLQRSRPPASPLEKSVPPTLLSLFPESPACSPRDR